MPKPLSRRELIKRMKEFGFSGPFPGKRHGAMRKGELTVAIPNPHGGDIDWTLTKRILKQAGIDPQEWENLG
jgi:hypothetical protein